MKRPLVTANFAITWDGRISTRARTPADFSSPRDKKRLLELRALADAVFVSSGTVKSDRMTMRGAPLRVLVSNSGRLDPALPVFTRPGAPLVVFSTERMPRRVRAALKAELHLTAADKVDLAAMLATLRRDFGVRRAHCEGGGQLLRALLAEELLDELYLTLCTRIFGSTTAATLTGPPGDFLPRSTSWKLLTCEPHGGECFLHYRRARLR